MKYKNCDNIDIFIVKVSKCFIFEDFWIPFHQKYRNEQKGKIRVIVELSIARRDEVVSVSVIRWPFILATTISGGRDVVYEGVGFPGVGRAVHVPVEVLRPPGQSLRGHSRRRTGASPCGPIRSRTCTVFVLNRRGELYGWRVRNSTTLLP